MGSCTYFVMALAMFLPLVSLGVTLASILTDFWYIVSPGSSNSLEHDYNFGIWRNCSNYLGKSCDFRDLIPSNLSDLTGSDKEYFALEISNVVFLIGCGGMQLFTIVAILCGLMPCKDAPSAKRTKMYLAAAIMLMFAAMFGMVSGICFIALRDLDSSSDSGVLYPAGTEKTYGYSFMLAWVSTGLTLINGFLFLHLLRVEYEDFDKDYDNM